MNSNSPTQWNDLDITSVPPVLGTLLAHAEQQWPERTAVVSEGTSLTYRELLEASSAYARGLSAFGIDPGDKVLIHLPNAPEFLIAFFGAIAARVIPVLCLSGHRDAELAHFTHICGAVAHLTNPHILSQVNPPMRSLTTDVVLAAGGAYTSVQSTHVPDPHDIALLLVSGGTTGLPKLIPRTHGDYRYNVTTAANVCHITEKDVYLATLPAAHNFTLSSPGVLGILQAGGTVVFIADPSPETAFTAIEEFGVTMTSLTPPLAALWTAATEWEDADLSSLRLVQVGGAKIEADRARETQNALGLDPADNGGVPGLQQVFGMAEGLLCFTRSNDPESLIFESQGLPMSEYDEVRLVDATGIPVAEGEVGELETRGLYTITGYFNAPEANARSFSPDGFYRSGDLARRLPSGHLVVVGRAKDVINRGGETISAEEIEGHLFAHPDIHSAAAVACPDALLGEKICAAVVVREGRGAADQPLDLPSLRAFLSDRGLSAEKQPDVLLTVGMLPMTAAGKVDKRAIAAQLA